MTGPEHYAEAERILDAAEDAAYRESNEWYLAAVTAAKVHATLALVAATIDTSTDGAYILGGPVRQAWGEVLS